MSMLNIDNRSRAPQEPQYRFLLHPKLKSCSHLPFFQRWPAKAGRKSSKDLLNDAVLYIFSLFTENTLFEIGRFAHQVDTPSHHLKVRLIESFPGYPNLTIFRAEAELFNVFFSYLEDPMGHFTVAILDVKPNGIRRQNQTCGDLKI